MNKVIYIQVQPYFIAASPHIYKDCINTFALISQFPNRSPKSLSFFSEIPNRPKSMISRSRAEHKMIEYLNPLQLFRQSKKRTYYMPSAVFLGLNFRDEDASVAISDKGYNTARIYGVYPRDQVMDKLVDVVQSLKKDRGYDLEGIIVANNNSMVPPVNIHYLMEGLCKKLNFQSLKYTCWKDNITPWSPELKCSRFGYSYCGTTFPLGCSIERVLPEIQEDLERLSAQPMLQAFLHVFNTLYMERDEKSMGRKKEREGKDEEREEFERKALQHDFNIKMKRYEESKRRKKSKGRKKERVGKDKERVESKRKVHTSIRLLHSLNKANILI